MLLWSHDTDEASSDTWPGFDPVHRFDHSHWFHLPPFWAGNAPACDFFGLYRRCGRIFCVDVADKLENAGVTQRFNKEQHDKQLRELNRLCGRST